MYAWTIANIDNFIYKYRLTATTALLFHQLINCTSRPLAARENAAAVLAAGAIRWSGSEYTGSVCRVFCHCLLRMFCLISVKSSPADIICQSSAASSRFCVNHLSWCIAQLLQWADPHFSAANPTLAKLQSQLLAKTKGRELRARKCRIRLDGGELLSHREARTAALIAA